MNFPRLISFTKAREKADFWENGELIRRKPPPISQASGEEARSFYESLLATEEEGKPSPRKECRKRKLPRPPSPASGSSRGPTCERTGHQLLKCAQNGDMKGLRRLVETEGCDVNFRDSFYWTALMCAAHAGNKEVVTYLLERGAAWIGVCDTRGRDALILAEDAGHPELVELLQKSTRRHPEEVQPRARPQERKYCEVCQTHYQEDSVATHERSTVHLFNKKKKLPPTYYAIPDHNVGFKLMLKEGWNREAGLGPEGAGRKFPVQTVLKRDQKGLGFQSDEKPKVTHFAARDPQAVARPQVRCSRTQRVATISRKEERRKEEKAKAWERDLRTYMNIDL